MKWAEPQRSKASFSLTPGMRNEKDSMIITQLTNNHAYYVPTPWCSHRSGCTFDTRCTFDHHLINIYKNHFFNIWKIQVEATSQNK